MSKYHVINGTKRQFIELGGWGFWSDYFVIVVLRQFIFCVLSLVNVFILRYTLPYDTGGS